MAMSKRFAVLTSGGDAPGMNPCIRGFALRCFALGVEPIGIRDGYKGLLASDFVPLAKGQFLDDLVKKGGTFLGTSRFPEFREPEVRAKAIAILKANRIDGLVGIGGDGTYHGLAKLSEEGFPVIGIPGTVDNDIALTDTTLGFQTAVDNCVDALNKIQDTMESHHRCFVVQVMGRYCPDIAIWSGLASGADAIVTKGNYVSDEDIALKAKQAREGGKRKFLVVVAENVLDVQRLAAVISAVSGFETKSEVLGHMQRGGYPCVYDRLLGTAFGAEAADCLQQGKSGICVGVVGGKIACSRLGDAIRGLHRTSQLAMDAERKVS